MQILVDNGSVIEKGETFIYDPIEQRYIHGCWIQGVCPNCNSDTGSYLCENCGTHYRPIDIYKEQNYPNAKLIKSSALYLKLDSERLFTQIEKVYDGSFVEILKKYLELQGSYIRLTTLQKTGVQFQWKSEEKQVIFTYLANLFAYIFFAEICKEKFELPEHPLAKDSSYVSIVSFGIDTVLPFTVGLMAVGSKLADYKSFDYYISNYLYNLNGEKFSTSRNHVIWGSDIVNISNIQSDAVRYYLTKQNLEKEEKNFDIKEFIDTVNKELYGEHNEVIIDAFAKIKNEVIYSLDDDLFKKLDRSINKQNDTITPPVFDFYRLTEVIQNWLKMYLEWSEVLKAQHCYWWLKGYTLLTYPIMPNISEKIWKSLSSTREVSLANFFNDNKLQIDNSPEIIFNKVTYESLEKCLPEKLGAVIN